MRRLLRRLLCVLCLLPAPAAARVLVQYEGGIGALSGDYMFSERTTSLSLMTGLGVERGRVTLRGSVPLWFQTSTLVTMTGSGLVPSGGGRVARDSSQTMPPHGGRDLSAEESVESRLLLGDPVFQLSVGVLQRLEGSVGTWLSVKVPATSTATFGTGEWDLGGGVSILRFVGTQWLGALEVSYWHLGDMATLDFQNPIGSIASLTHFTGDWAISVSGSASSAVLPGYEPLMTIGTGLTRRVGPGSWSANLTFGLTDSAAQLGVGVLWRVPLLMQ